MKKISLLKFYCYSSWTTSAGCFALLANTNNWHVLNIPTDFVTCCFYWTCVSLSLSHTRVNTHSLWSPVKWCNSLLTVPKVKRRTQYLLAVWLNREHLFQRQNIKAQNDLPVWPHLACKTVPANYASKAIHWLISARINSSAAGTSAQSTAHTTNDK